MAIRRPVRRRPRGRRQGRLGLPSELKEPGFDALRGRADFQKLVAEVDAKAEKVPDSAPQLREKR